MLVRVFYLSLLSFAAGYSVASRVAVARRMRGGLANVCASASAPPADAVSMKVRVNIASATRARQALYEIYASPPRGLSPA